MFRHSLRPVALALPVAAAVVALPALAVAQAPVAWPPAPSATQAPATAAPAAVAPTATQAPAASAPSGGAAPAGDNSAASQSPTPPAGTDAQTPSAQPGPEQPASPPEHGMGHPYYPGQGRPPQAGRGFVISAALGVQPFAVPVLSDNGITAVGSTGFTGQVAIGYKFGRAILTLGLSLGSVFDKLTLQSSASTAFQVVPGLQVALVRSRDQRAELIGVLRFGAGATMPSTSGGSSALKPDTLLFYEIAPGARYWMHTQFAFQVTAGYAGQWLITNNSTSGELIGAHGVSASLGAVGIF